jgi:deoxycytidine triphosphate deaminase
MRLAFAFWSAKPICIPRNPKLIFQICQKESLVARIFCVGSIVFTLIEPGWDHDRR